MEMAERGDEQGALAELEQALLQDSDAPAGQRVRWSKNAALLCDGLGRSDGALSHYGYALELDPLDGFTHLAIANLYKRLGRHSDAERHTVRARLLARDDAELAEVMRSTPESLDP
jgi:tetratricopeptide (TPR) repeat protein